MRIKIEDFSAGINSLTHPTKLGDAEFPVYENIITKAYGDRGAGVKRNGFSAYSPTWTANKILQSLYEASFSAGSRMLGNIADGSNSVLYYSADPYTGAPTLIQKNKRWDTRVQFAMLKDKVYMANLANGSANYMYDSTNILEMGCPPLNMCTLAGSIVGGGSLVGTYNYFMTYVYDGFQESGCMTWYDIANTNWFPHLNAGGGSLINFTNIPVGGTRVTARKIYRTKGNDNTTFYYLTTIQDNTTILFTDNIPDSELGDEIDPMLLTDMKKPYISKYNIVHKDRMIQANLTENFYTPLASGDITLTPTAGGSLTIGGTYTYKFYKVWVDNAAGKLSLRFSPPYTVAATLTALNQSFSIGFTGTADWYGVIAFQRTSTSGGTTYLYPTAQSTVGYRTADFPIVDGVATASMVNNPKFIIYADGSVTNYSGWVSFSNVSAPDLISGVSVEKIGQDNGDHITTIFSEEDRIIVFKQKDIYAIDTRALDSTFWYANKIVSGIGCDDFACKQIKGGYVFKTTRTVAGLGTLDVVYLWDGRSTPIPIGDKLLNYAKGIINNSINFKDLSYDASNEWVWLIYSSDRSNPGTVYFIYDLNEGKWMAWFNDTASFSSACITDTKSYGVLIGDEYGFINSYSATAFQDTINGTARDYTAAIKTKTYEIPDADLFIRNGCIDCEAGANFTGVTLKYSVDGGAEQSMAISGTASIFNRLKTLNHPFTNANDKTYRQVYFKITQVSNGSFKLLNFVMDLDKKHEEAMGR